MQTNLKMQVAMKGPAPSNPNAARKNSDEVSVEDGDFGDTDENILNVVSSFAPHSSNHSFNQSHMQSYKNYPKRAGFEDVSEIG